MAGKPTYLGLLNAIAVGELGGEQLFEAWAAVTPSDEVRAVLRTVALREGEHARSFAKRIDELGFAVRDRPDPDQEGRLAIACSTSLSDREKFERLGFAAEPEPGPDFFARFLDDTSIDIETGTLLGRYISEERDTGRRLRACHAQLVAAERTTTVGPTADQIADRLDRLERRLVELTEAIASANADAPATRESTKKRRLATA